MRLESSIRELHDMFMDIAMLVENQVAARPGPPGVGGGEGRAPEEGTQGLWAR